jgi:hypothetical protein
LPNRILLLIWYLIPVIDPHSEFFSLKPYKRGAAMAEEGFKRKLTAILSADVIGYSRRP